MDIIVSFSGCMQLHIIIVTAIVCKCVSFCRFGHLSICNIIAGYCLVVRMQVYHCVVVFRTRIFINVALYLHSFCVKLIFSSILLIVVYCGEY